MSRVRRPLLRVTVVVLLLTLVLVGMIARKQWTLTTGTPVVLETNPIDPRSLFRGDYVRLRYAISTLETAEYPGLAEVERGDEVCVGLAPGDPFWRPTGAGVECPEEAPVAIRGRVERVSRRWNRETRSYEADRTVWVKYGIESYFVPEGEGRSLERPREGEVVSIRVAVDRFGRAGIRAVLVNGEPRHVERLF